jgi:hypothetical protein
MDIDLNQVHYVANSSSSASEYWWGRASEAEMADFNGISAHIKWPYNDHWDCSVERVDLWAMWAREILGQAPILKDTVKVQRLQGQREDYIGLGVDGHIYHRIYDATTPSWIPANDAWTAMGSPNNNAGGVKDVSVHWLGDFLNIVAVGADHGVYLKRHHPSTGWVNWERVGSLHVNQIATAVRTVLV